MQTSKRWYDSGCNRVPSINTRIAAYSLSNIESAAKISLTLERDSQDVKRAELHQTQHMHIELTENEAVQLMQKISEKIDDIKFFRQNGRWKDYQDKQV